MNHKDRPAGDITKISADLVPDHELLVGGFPCQTFSSSGTQMGFEDDRGLLFLEVVRLLKQKQPKAFLLENVRGLVTHKGCATLQTILSELHDSGYAVQYEVLDAVNLVPQERKRVYLVGIRNGLDNQSYRFPNFETLSHRGFVDIEQRDLSLEAIETLCLTEHQLEKVKSQKYTIRFPESRFLSNKSKATKTLQSSYASYMVGSQFVPAPKEAISRWRRLSPREAARLQGFPENFQLCSARPYHLLGNAVVPSMIVLVAAPLLPLLYATEEEASNWETKGWQVAARLLLDASPADERKAKFQSSIEQIAKAAIYRVQ